MDKPPPLERLAAWVRGHPFGFDVALAGAAVLFTVLLPIGKLHVSGQEVLVGLLLTVPIAWRRRAPVPAAAVVTSAGLLELLVVPDLLPAAVAVLVVIYALAAYAPRWASRAGLAAGLVGAVLAGLRYFSAEASDALPVTIGSMGVAAVAAWALGDLRRARVQEETSMPAPVRR